MFIKLIKSTFHNEKETKRRLVKFIEGARSLSMGEQCRNFEEQFAKKQGRKYAVFVNSGSSANLVLIQALLNLGRLKQGDRVGVSAITWATNVMPILQMGLQPVAIDCELSTLNISSKTLAPHLKGLKALFLTNVLGFSSDISAIKNACAKAKVMLLEDNCESLGSKVDGKLLGNFGLAATFSFFVGHHLSTIEGGMVVTDDEKLHDMLVMVRAHGWDRHLPLHKQKKLRTRHEIDEHYGKYTFYELAYNVRPTEIQGFLGLESLRYWDEIVGAREQNFHKIFSAVLDHKDFHNLDVSHMDIVSNFAFPVIAKSERLAKEYRKRFENAGVEVRPIISGDITLHPFWKKYVGTAPILKNSRTVHYQGFYFGNNPDLTKKEIDFLCSLFSVK